MLRRLPIVLYALLPLLFVGGNLLWRTAPGTTAVRWPVLHRTPAAAAPEGAPIIVRLDLPALKQSINRLPSVALLRETGNSLRLAGGQKLSWCIWGNTTPLTLFHKVELWVSEGLTPVNLERVDGALATISKYHTILQREGWILVVVPVPSKLSIYSDRYIWPCLETDPLTRRPIERDRADEVYDRLVGQLQAEHIPVIDVRALFRAERLAHPDALLYPPGETHWSGHGLKITADATAELVSSLSGVHRRQITPRYLEVEEVADMAKGFDPLPQWPSRLQPVYRYKDRLVSGDVTAGFQYAQNPTSLMFVAGTSYSGQFVWHVGEPVGFAWAIGGQLEECEFYNGAQAGHGSYAAFETFLAEREGKAADFSRRRNLRDFPKIVVWEFPIRDLAALVNR